jgi:hypothetical protein
VFAAEMYNPDTEAWSTMASMQIRRLYHSTALLLPDGRVLSAGSGFPPGPGEVNQPNYEIYSPPYLFKGPRPTITAAPSEVALNTNFFITTPDAASISKVTMIRLGSVTHAFNQNQRLTELIFRPQAGGLEVQFPGGANITPSGHYMLFLVNSNGVPSVASIVKISFQTSGSNSIDDARYFVPCTIRTSSIATPSTPPIVLASCSGRATSRSASMTPAAATSSGGMYRTPSGHRRTFDHAPT